MIVPAFDIGETVYLLTDVDQLPRIVTGYLVRKDMIIYYLSQACSETTHYDFEICRDKQLIL